MKNKSFEAFEADIIRKADSKILVGGNDEGHSTNTSDFTLGIQETFLAPVPIIPSLDVESDGDWVSDC